MMTTYTQEDLKERGHLILEILKRELAQFIRDVADREHHLEDMRMRLSCHFSNPISEMFIWLDTNRKGRIDATDLQIFLMNNKYYFQGRLLKKFIQKYSHNNITLDVNEFYKILLPRNRYQQLSQSLRWREGEGPCAKMAGNLYKSEIAKLLKSELQALKLFIEGKNELMRHALRNGTTLWRLIDKQFQNSLNFQHCKNFINGYKINFTYENWLCFLQYTTEIGKDTLTMRQFLTIFNPEEFQKQAFEIEIKKLQYPFEKDRVELELQRQWRQLDWEKRDERWKQTQLQEVDGIVEEGKQPWRSYSKKDIATMQTASTFNLEGKKSLDQSRRVENSLMKSLVKEVSKPVWVPIRPESQKKLMKYKDIGYATTKNHIKVWNTDVKFRI